MKLIYAIVSSDDTNAVSTALTKEGFFATKLATTGGFLKAGNTTFLICTEKEKVDRAIQIITKHSKKREAMLPSAAGGYGVSTFTPFPVEVTVGGATIFVTAVEKFEKI